MLLKTNNLVTHHETKNCFRSCKAENIENIVASTKTEKINETTVNGLKCCVDIKS